MWVAPPASCTIRDMPSLALSDTSSKTTNPTSGFSEALICASMAATRCGFGPLTGVDSPEPDPPQAAASRTAARAVLLMPEMAFTRHHHRDAGRVGGAHHLGIAHRPSGLDDGRDAGRDALLQPVREREEGVRGHHAALGPGPGAAHRDL